MHKYLWIVLLFLVSCTHLQRPTQREEYLASTDAVPAAFTAVNIYGQLNVNLHTGSKSSFVQFQGSPQDLNDVRWSVQQGVLTVRRLTNSAHPAPVTLDIYSHYLSAFSYHGSGQISGKKLRTYGLKLDVDNHGSTMFDGDIGVNDLRLSGAGQMQVDGLSSQHLTLKLAGNANLNLKGKVALADVRMQDNSRLSLYWVDSRVLTVRAKDSAKIQLAGVVDWMDVQLRGSAVFNGRYLRATRAFVKTFDAARADVFITARQHTLASGKSNIYVFELPAMKTDFMAFQGSVLDLRGWSRWNYKEPS